MEVGAEVVLIYDVSVNHLLLKTWRLVRFRCLTALGLDRYGRGSHSSKVGTFLNRAVFVAMVTPLPKKHTSH